MALPFKARITTKNIRESLNRPTWGQEMEVVKCLWTGKTAGTDHVLMREISITVGSRVT